jgi:hemerythrin
MTLITWDTSYSVGVKELDDQHQELLSLVGKLYAAMNQEKGKGAIIGALGDLIEHKRSHFATEERLMACCGYPGYTKHKSEHEALLQNLLEFQGRYLTGRADLNEQVLSVMENWISEHILSADQKYVPFLISKGLA